MRECNAMGILNISEVLPGMLHQEKSQIFPSIKMLTKQVQHQFPLLQDDVNKEGTIFPGRYDLIGYWNDKTKLEAVARTACQYSQFH